MLYALFGTAGEERAASEGGSGPSGRHAEAPPPPSPLEAGLDGYSSALNIVGDKGVTSCIHASTGVPLIEPTMIRQWGALCKLAALALQHGSDPCLNPRLALSLHATAADKAPSRLQGLVAAPPVWPPASTRPPGQLPRSRVTLR